MIDTFPLSDPDPPIVDAPLLDSGQAPGVVGHSRAALYFSRPVPPAASNFLKVPPLLLAVMHH